jgi:predicted phage terminase large subunit-like protein
VCLGVIGRSGANYYVLDLDWRRMSFTSTLDAIRAMCRKWPRLRAKLIEDKANGPAIIDTLRKEISGIIAVTPEGGKEARANAVEPFFAAHNVHFPDPDGAVIQPDKNENVVRLEWVERLKSELLNFPMGKNDDAVDMLSQALLYFRTKRSKWVQAMTKITAQANERAQAATKANGGSHVG